MHGILATFNEYQSRESGADIAYKMGQKAKNGGTIGRARLGYLNVRDRFDGREIRTIAVDPERAPFVQLAFELYATGDYSLDDLSDELYDRGLRTRPTGRHPAKQVSINKLSMMLRDRYYLGYVEVDGEEVQGRHEPLIDEDLFDRVQDLLESRSTAGERRREHHHYLKGSLFCGRCKRAGITQRLIIQHTVNSRGSEYTYFFCRNKQNGSCEAPHINVALIEDAVENHYATIRFSPQFIADRPRPRRPRHRRARSLRATAPQATHHGDEGAGHPRREPHRTGGRLHHRAGQDQDQAPRDRPTTTTPR